MIQTYFSSRIPNLENKYFMGWDMVLIHFWDMVLIWLRNMVIVMVFLWFFVVSLWFSYGQKKVMVLSWFLKSFVTVFVSKPHGWKNYQPACLILFLGMCEGFSDFDTVLIQFLYGFDTILIRFGYDLDTILVRLGYGDQECDQYCMQPNV